MSAVPPRFAGGPEARERAQQLQHAANNVIAVGRVVKSSYCDHSGWGLKQGSIIKSWKRRYFVLKGLELIYFAERSPSGKGIDEKGRLRISRVEFTPEFTNALLVKGELKNQAVKMQVETNDESALWFKKITEALQAAGQHDANGRLAGDSAGGDVAMQGWLLKEGQNFKTWKRRHMTLRGRVIQYRAQPHEKPLGEARVNDVNINNSRPFALDVYSDNNRILRLQADSFAEIEAWDQALARATGKRECFGDPYAGQEAPFLGETFEESVLYEGWLYKRGQRSTAWQKRYFVLKGFTLQYQDGPGESVPKGAGTVVGLKLGEPGTNCLDVQLGTGRVLCVSADSQSQIDKWVQVICSVLDKDPHSLEKEGASVPAIGPSTAASASTGEPTGGSGRLGKRTVSNASSGALSSGSRSSLNGPGGYLEGYEESAAVGVAGVSSESLLRSSAYGRTSSFTSGDVQTTGSIRKCGWLRKEGARVRSLKRRYFMADGNKLYYFEQIGEAPRGNGVVTSAVFNDTYPNSLDFNLASGRKMRVVAESPDEIRSWFDHFNGKAAGRGSLGAEGRQSDVERQSLEAEGETRGSIVADSGTGWLLKKGANFKTWKRRFFELDGKQLSYSSAPGAPALGRGVVEHVALGNARPFCLDVRFQNGRVLQVVAASEPEMVAWNHVLQVAMQVQPEERDLLNDTQFDFDDAEEEVQLANMRTVVTATTAFKRGLSKKTSSLENSAVSSPGGNETQRAEAAAKTVANAIELAGRRRGQRSASVAAENLVVCSGWMRKEGGTVKNWKRRYFTLHGTTLCYFKSDNGPLLRNLTVCHVVNMRSKKLCLEITAESGRKLLVATETQEDLERWLAHLHEAIATDKRKKLGSGNERHSEGAASIRVAKAEPIALPVPGMGPDDVKDVAYQVL